MTPFITADLPGSGGEIKLSPEDFRVDELPAYDPAGTGPHLYLHVEKRGRNTRDVVAELAQKLQANEREAGYAGLKDKQAVTTQWLSFLSAKTPTAAELEGNGWSVLAVSRHQNKLKPGHSKGNRFSIAVHGGKVDAALASAAALADRGLPNFFGDQRFGARGDNAEAGRGIILGKERDLAPHLARMARDRTLRRLAISAFQSMLFNTWLSERIAAGHFATALRGDLMKKLETGGLFDCEDPAVDGPRVAAFEISPTGPIFGHKMRASSGDAAEHEARVLAAEGVSLADFTRGRGEAEGTRRAARLRVAIGVEPIASGYRATFELPKGSYATVVMGELLKTTAHELPD